MTAEAFWSRTGKGEPGSCWEWKRGRITKGYGAVWWEKKQMYAHRVAWELANGMAVPDGLFVCHTCDNPPCCNPAHLWVGTAADNIADMDAKGRSRRQPVTSECRKGHPYDADNTGVSSNGKFCRECARIKHHERYLLERTSRKPQKPWNPQARTRAWQAKVGTARKSSPSECT